MLNIPAPPPLPDPPDDEKPELEPIPPPVLVPLPEPELPPIPELELLEALPDPFPALPPLLFTEPPHAATTTTPSDVAKNNSMLLMRKLSPCPYRSSPYPKRSSRRCPLQHRAGTRRRHHAARGKS
jgi:hypothetical protein